MKLLGSQRLQMHLKNRLKEAVSINQVLASFLKGADLLFDLTDLDGFGDLSKPTFYRFLTDMIDLHLQFLNVMVFIHEVKFCWTKYNNSAISK